jgi:hypothetical protein
LLLNLPGIRIIRICISMQTTGIVNQRRLN